MDAPLTLAFLAGADQYISTKSNRAPIAAYEVQNQGNYGENDQEVNQTSCDVEHNPCEQPSDN